MLSCEGAQVSRVRSPSRQVAAGTESACCAPVVERPTAPERRSFPAALDVSPVLGATLFDGGVEPDPQPPSGFHGSSVSAVSGFT